MSAVRKFERAVAGQASVSFEGNIPAGACVEGTEHVLAAATRRAEALMGEADPTRRIATLRRTCSEFDCPREQDTHDSGHWETCIMRYCASSADWTIKQSAIWPCSSLRISERLGAQRQTAGDSTMTIRP